MPATIVDPPPVLWARGPRSLAGALGRHRRIARRVAVRPRGRGTARGGSRPAPASRIVSGLARGVDSAAHRGALAAGGAAVAVLGSGVDVIYPPRARAARARDRSGRARRQRAAAGHAAAARHFPRRNRIISGLSRGVVVVEAGEKSGSLITARCALEQGRDVMAVPGNVLSGRNRGAHALLRDGAKLVECGGRYPGCAWPVVRPRPPYRDGTSGAGRTDRDRLRARVPARPREDANLDELIAERRAFGRRVCCRGCSSSNWPASSSARRRPVRAVDRPC